MTTPVKQILLIFGILGGAGILFLAVIIGIAKIATSSPAFKKEAEARKAEGRELGKTTDQSGCMKEALSRARKVRGLDLQGGVILQEFTEECLKTSSPTPAFCDGVPSVLNPVEDEWRRKQCRDNRFDGDDLACLAVFKAKMNTCH